MVFNSAAFLAFFPLFYVGYLLLLNRSLPRKVWTLLGSSVFYAWWDWRFLGLIGLSIVVNHYLADRISKTNSEPEQKSLLAAVVAFNLVLLGTFKYLNFFIDSFVELFGAVGVGVDSPTLNIILPVGISFFTFQALSYVIDTYRGTLEKPASLIDFAVYLSLFPQLVAGPIVRASTLIPQISAPLLTWRRVQTGLSSILWGFFLKLVLAENAGAIADQAFSAPEFTSPDDALFGTFAFSMQIYGDFAGYSLIAIGLGNLLGFEFGSNFNRPYFASSFRDFWQRWHISLSSWLRDYLYIALGGNRKGRARMYANLCITMLLGGLWHGALWKFVVWGGLHGVYLVVERVAGSLGVVRRGEESVIAPVFSAFYRLLVIAGVGVAWVFFRASDMGDALTILELITQVRGPLDINLFSATTSVFLFGCVVVLVHDLLGELSVGDRVSNVVVRAAPQLAWNGGIFVSIMILARFSTAPFIYFQF